MPTFYDYALAPSPRRARIALAEKGMKVETVQIDLRAGEQLGEAYRKINPRCTVPALRLDDGTILTDSFGIATWAEATKPTPALFGTTPTEKGIVASWCMRVDHEGYIPAAEAFRNTTPAFKGRALTGPVGFEQLPPLAERGRAVFARFLDTLEERLAGREFIAIDSFTYPDILALVAIDFARWSKLEPGPQHENLKRWHAAVSARPSAKA